MNPRDYVNEASMKRKYLDSLVAEIERRRPLPTKRLRRQRQYLAVRLRFLTPASIDAAIGNARILLELIGEPAVARRAA
jgi:hypothetical protein